MIVASVLDRASNNVIVTVDTPSNTVKADATVTILVVNGILISCRFISNL